jgi:acyl-CoA thioesterase I
MFELPLIPDRIAYGQIQRRLAAKYGIHLIPKRYFVRVITGAEATSDGLHLSKTGAQRMAHLVAQVLSEVLKPESHSKSQPAEPHFTLL